MTNYDDLSEINCKVSGGFLPPEMSKLWCVFADWGLTTVEVNPCSETVSVLTGCCLLIGEGVFVLNLASKSEDRPTGFQRRRRYGRSEEVRPSGVFVHDGQEVLQHLLREP